MTPMNFRRVHSLLSLIALPVVAHCFCERSHSRPHRERAFVFKPHDGFQRLSKIPIQDQVEDENDDQQPTIFSHERGSNLTGMTRRGLLVGSSFLTVSAFLERSNNHAALAMDDAESKRIDIFEKASKSVVFIDTFTERRDAFTTNVLEVPLGSGSGFIWDSTGHIVTNYHVVRNAKSAQVAILSTDSSTISGVSKPGLRQVSGNDGGVVPFTSMKGPSSSFSSSSQQAVFKATVVGVDPAKDIAVLKVDAPTNLLKPVSIGTSKGLKVGQQSLAIGNPFGLDHTLTAGIISGLGREVKSPIGRPITGAIQTDASINPGYVTAFYSKSRCLFDAPHAI